MTEYESRTRALEEQGLTRSDAQGTVDLVMGPAPACD